MNEIIIDEQCIFCPFWLKKVGGNLEPHFSDHNAFITKLIIPNVKYKKQHRPSKWKITPEGLHKFEGITSQFDASLPPGSAQHMYNGVEGRLNNTMEKCFRKTKGRRSTDLQGKYLGKYKQISEFAKKGKAQRKAAKLYIQELVKLNTDEVAYAVKENVKWTLKNLTIDNKFSPDSFWKLCKKSRTKTITGTSVVNENGVELFGEDLIRNAHENEFKHRLRKREIIPELRNYELRTEQVCQLRLEEAKNRKEESYTSNELQVVKKNLKPGKACGRDLFPPDIFIRGGCQMDSLLLSMFTRLKNEECLPLQWTEVLITCIYKNKGSKKLLVNHRGSSKYCLKCLRN